MVFHLISGKLKMENVPTPSELRQNELTLVVQEDKPIELILSDKKTIYDLIKIIRPCTLHS